MIFLPPEILKKVILSSLMKYYLYTINHFHLLKNTFRARKIKPWITTEFRHIITTKNKLYQHYLNKPSVYNDINCKIYRNKLNCLNNIAEKTYYQRDLQNHKHKDNLQNTWKILKALHRKENSSFHNRPVRNCWQIKYTTHN